jgi:hypothetical protein
MYRSTYIPAALGRREFGLVLAGVFVVLATVLSIIRADRGYEWDPTAAIIAYGTLAYSFVGITVLWRRPGHGIGRLALTIGIAFAIVPILRALLPAASGPGPLRPVYDIGIGVTDALPIAALFFGGILMIVWFPDGHRTSRIGGLVELILAGAIAATLASGLGLISLGDDVMFGAVVAGFAGAWIDLAIRYSRADQLRRAQIRWVLGAVAMNVVLALLVFGPASGDEGLGWVWGAWLASTGLPILAIAIAITRYHLYDIDRIISRTIGYAVVTAILFAAFWGANLLLLRAINPATGSHPVVVAGTTLVVAALFNPLRIRIQRVVDRRFDRARYDAERTAEIFVGRLRDELDLAVLAGELRQTATEAVAPTTSTVWLRRPGIGR